MPCLYEVILQHEWQQVEEKLRQFHEQGLGCTGEGRFVVKRGPGFLGRLFAAVMLFPPEGDNVQTHLEVKRSLDGENKQSEKWKREFNQKRFYTEQYAYKGMLAEKMGPLELVMKLTVNNGAICFSQAGAAFVIGPVRIPFPGFLSPSIAGRQSMPANNTLRTHITTGLPMIGSVISYDGDVTVASTT